MCINADNRTLMVLEQWVTLSFAEIKVENFSVRPKSETFWLLFLSLSLSKKVTSAFSLTSAFQGGSVAEWLACWTQAQKGPGSNHSRDAVW